MTMKYIIISTPKSGTYLCANLLQQFGLAFTYRHIGPTDESYEQYDSGDLVNGLQNPSQYHRTGSGLDGIRDGSFAVGHIKPTDGLRLKLKGFKKIFLTRPDVARGQSGKRFQRHVPSYRHRTSKVLGLAGWLKDDVYHLRFEDMIIPDVRRVDSLQLHLFGEVRFDSLESCEEAKRMESLTKSDMRRVDGGKAEQRVS